jgi:hypothetical protein
MSRTSMTGPIRPALAVLVVLLAASPAAPTTVCDTTSGRVLFTPTVDPSALNGFLAFLGNQTITPPTAPLVIPGLCTDHQIAINTGVSHLPFGSSTFMVTPSLGQIRVDLNLPGPYNIGIDGSNYQQVHCSNSFPCNVTIPYINENGCDIESNIVRPVLGLLHAGASWDDIKATQIADTCVLPNCTAVNPLESSSVNLTNFQLHTGISCEVCLPAPLPHLCLDPCLGSVIDPLISNLVEPTIENAINGILKPKPDEGLLIDVFAWDITHDFFCLDIPEVTACKNRNPVAAAVGPRDHGVNALFYSLPMGVAGVLAFRLRRRSARKPPA